MTRELYMVELEYANYLAEQEMLDTLAILSIKSKGILTESVIESINEAAVDAIMNAISKIVANIQVAWNKFKAVINKGEYALFQKEYGNYLNGNTIMKIDNAELCTFAKVDDVLNKELPALAENMLSDLDTPETFIEKYFKEYYDKEKSLADKMIEYVFSQEETANIGPQVIKFYTSFMENYQSKVNKVADDLKNINNASNTAKQILEKNKNNTSSNTTDNKPEDNTNNDNKEGAHKESFTTLAESLLYYFTEDDNKEKTTYTNLNNPDSKGSSGGNNDVAKQISNYYKASTKVISAKLTILNKSRKNALTVLNKYGAMAKDNSKTKYTNAGNQKSDNSNSAEPKINL